MIMLETWNLERKYTEIWSTERYVASENIPFSTKTSLILIISAFFGKDHHSDTNFCYSFLKLLVEQVVIFSETEAVVKKLTKADIIDFNVLISPKNSFSSYLKCIYLSYLHLLQIRFITKYSVYIS